MRKYQYQIVRYIHDLVTSEFVNVGIVIYQPDIKFVSSKFINKYSRISQFFGEINGQYLISVLKQFSTEINNVNADFNSLFGNNVSSIEDITSKILLKDDSSLVCSEVFYGIDLNEEIALADLFDRLVYKYQIESEKNVVNDNYVWRKVYKTHFDKYGITNKLKPHTVKTSHDHIEFDLAWKNGCWNVYQTLSFDLKNKDSIKRKVYKWSGIINELENTREGLHIYLLTKTPQKDKNINKFINDTLNSKSGKDFIVTLVHENEAEQFAVKVKKEIESHSNY